LRCSAASSPSSSDDSSGFRDSPSKGLSLRPVRQRLGDDADELDGFEFLTMAEAAEVGHWQIVGKLNERANLPGLQELVQWVTPIQQRHFEQSLEGSLKLAAEEDPNESES